MRDRGTYRDRESQKEVSETTLGGNPHYPLFINVPLLWPVVAFSPHRCRFHLRTAHVGFVVDKVAL